MGRTSNRKVKLEVKDLAKEILKGREVFPKKAGDDRRGTGPEISYGGRTVLSNLRNKSEGETNRLIRGGKRASPSRSAIRGGSPTSRI